MSEEEKGKNLKDKKGKKRKKSMIVMIKISNLVNGKRKRSMELYKMCSI